MAQAVIASWDWYNEDSASPLTVTKPAGFVPGELLLVMISQHAGTSQAALDAMTTPAGWIFEALYNEASNQGKLFSHKWKPGDPATWDFGYDSGADVCLACIRITGAETENPMIVFGSTNHSSIGASADSPSVTPKGVNDLLICFLANICSNNAFSETDPSGMTDRGQTQAAVTFHAMAGVSQALTSSAATGVRTWTSISPTAQHGETISITVKSAADISFEPFRGLSPGQDGPTGSFQQGVFPDVAAAAGGDANPAAQTATSAGSAPDPQASVAPGIPAATGAGVAQTPAAAIAGTGGLATGSGTPGAPNAAIGVSPTTATGSGAALNPTVTAGTTAAAGVATGTGVASNTQAGVGPSGGSAAGTGIAQTPAAGIAGTGGLATGSGTPGAAAAGIGVSPTAATGTGTAQNATVTTSGNTNAAAGVAAGTGTAQTPAASVGGTGGLATGTGTPGTSNAAIGVSPTTATGTGAANNATVATGSFANAEAGAATGTGAAQNATATVATRIGAAAGTGSALNATVAIGTGVNAGVATGAGVANGVTASVAPGAPAAAGAGAANGATIATSTAGTAGTAGGSGAANGVRAGVAPTAQAGTGTGSALPPQIGGTVIINPMATSFGPCPWESVQCCVFPTGSEAITGNIVTAATEVLWQKTGQRYGLCTTTIRPCREDCFGRQAWPFNGTGWAQWGGTYPMPLLYRGLWYNVGCAGGCDSTCSCTVLQETTLPGPVNAVTEVKLDGVVMATTSYRLDDNRKLVRTDGGLWPACQDLTLPDTALNTWSVTFQWGEQVPVIGRQALGQLACALARECQGEDCRLPKNVTSLIRQGVSVTLPEDWLRQMTFVDLFLDYANPHGLDGAAAIYDPDETVFRRVGA